MSDNQEALKMADDLDRLCDPYDSVIAAELRRLHAENDQLRHAMDGLTQRCVHDTALIGELVEALQLAISSYGVMMMGNPPQEAWDVWKVDEKARAALAKWEASK